MRRYGLGWFSLLFLCMPSDAIEWSGTLEGEYAARYATARATTSATGESSNRWQTQKLQSLLSLEGVGELPGDVRYTLIPKVYFDAQDEIDPDDEKPDSYSSYNGPLYSDSHTRVELSEAYIDMDLLGGYWRVGKQQVVWGQADGVKVLDKVNPQKFSEFILDVPEDSRIPLWMINAEFPVSMDMSLQAIVIPDLSFHEMADRNAAYAITSPELAPRIPDGQPVTMEAIERPPGERWEYGLRWSMFVSGWDVRVNYLNHYHDSAVHYRRLDGQTWVIAPRYERSDLLGLTASNAFGDVTLRTEVGYASDTFHLTQNLDNNVGANLNESGVHASEELSSVIGLDYQGFSNTLLSYQWFQSRLLSYHPHIVRRKQSHRHSVLLRRDALNDTLHMSLFVLHNNDYGDGMMQSRLEYQLEDNIDLWLAADWFYGDQLGPFGQFDSQDRIVLGARYGF